MCFECISFLEIFYCYLACLNFLHYTPLHPLIKVFTLTIFALVFHLTLLQVIFQLQIYYSIFTLSNQFIVKSTA